MRRLSIVIPNFNYRTYVAAAIESALAVDWADVEVIVVDDGSTDGSFDIIRGYGDRITALQQPNSGPRVACNTGFAHSSGDAVLFLDSDDVVDAGIARIVAEHWRPGVSKIQVQMQRIDSEGVAIGAPFPPFDPAPSPQIVRHWMSTTSAYPTPPGSGNVYSREFLEQLFPLDDRCGDATDSACLAAAPFLGDVVTVARPLVGYRIHGENRSNVLVDPARFTRQIERAHQRHLFALEVSGDDAAEPLAALFRGRHLLQMRIAERRMVGGPPPIPGDGPWRMARDCVGNIGAPGPEPLSHRAIIAAWSLLALVAPLPLARELVRMRFGLHVPKAGRRR